MLNQNNNIQLIKKLDNNNQPSQQSHEISLVKSDSDLSISDENHNISYDASYTYNMDNSFTEENSYLIIDNSQSPVIPGISRNDSSIKKSNSLSPNRMNVMGNDIYSHNISNNNVFLFKSNSNGSNSRGNQIHKGNIYSQSGLFSVSNKSHMLTNMEKVRIMKENHKNKEVNIRYDLIVELSEGTHQCLICFDSIKPTDKIWNCSDCYLAIHLSCIMKWNREYQKNTWSCPVCRKKYDKFPTEYYCFCGKTHNPAFNEYIIPHSCGNSCGHKRKDCGHYCKDRCHPGPCAPCREVIGYRKCNCGRHSYICCCFETKSEPRSCGEPCGRLLNCGIHYCKNPCHPGPCENCAELITESCMCGQELRFQICGQKQTYVDSKGRMFTFKNFVPSLSLPYVSCGRPCKRIRNDCGHVCGRTCHADRCTDQPCTAKCGKIKSCGHPCDRPCGHSEACDAEKCKSICGADKTCCLHQCKALCHSGTPCPEDKPCTEKIMAMCECLGQTFEMMCGATKSNPNLLPYIELECNCKPKKVSNSQTSNPEEQNQLSQNQTIPPLSL